MSKTFWRGFLRGLGDPTAMTLVMALALPVFAYLEDDPWTSFFAAFLGALCWLVIVGAVVRRKLGWDRA